MEDISRAELKHMLLELLKTDEELRLAVTGLIGLDEVLRRLEEHDKKFNEILERSDRQEAELAKLRNDLNRLREDMNRGFELLRRHIDALGARWGLLAEEAFREGLKVERWTVFDEEGLVYGHPSQVEVDVAIRDGRVILVEVSSHVGASDIAVFRRKAEVYARKTGRKPDELIVITPYAEERALRLARELGITVHTRV